MITRAAWMDESWHTDGDADVLAACANPEAEWQRRNAAHLARQRGEFPGAAWRPGTPAGLQLLTRQLTEAGQ